MSFWSSQTLKRELSSLITPFDISKVESASYPLRIGNEIFVTKDHLNSDSQHTKRILGVNEDFDIPPGQFAFLLTEETVKVPANAIAFISMKASIKYKGLVNISGFHVDPGFEGKLLFSVYNAGPSRIRLNQMQPCFLIWYASLDEIDANARNKPGYISFPTEVLDKISTDKIYSLQALTTGFRELEFNVSQKVTEINAIKKETDGAVTFFKWVGGVLATILVAGAISLYISLPKFIIEQRELLGQLVEYKDILDELVEAKKLSIIKNKEQLDKLLEQKNSISKSKTESEIQLDHK
jgi:dCTP deaminase